MAEAMLEINTDVIVGHLKLMFPQFNQDILQNVATARTAGLEEAPNMDIIMSNCIDDLSGMDAGPQDDNNGDIIVLDSSTELPRSYGSLNANKGTGPSPLVDLTRGTPEILGPPRRKRRRQSPNVQFATLINDDEDSIILESDENSSELPDLDSTDGRSRRLSRNCFLDLESNSSQSSSQSRETSVSDSLDGTDSRSGRASTDTRNTATPDSLPDLDLVEEDGDGQLPDIDAATIDNVLAAGPPAPAKPAVVATATAGDGKPMALTATVTATVGNQAVISATVTAAGSGATVKATASGPVTVTPIGTSTPVAKAPGAATAFRVETQAGPVLVTPIAPAAPLVAPRLVTATAAATQATAVHGGPVVVVPETPPQPVVNLQVPPVLPLPVLPLPVLPLHDPFPELLAPRAPAQREPTPVLEPAPQEPTPVLEPPPREPTPVPEPPREPTAEEIFEEKVDTVLKLFPLVEPDYLRTTMKGFLANEVEFMVNHLLENDSYPRIQKKKPITPQAFEKINYFDVSRIKTQKHSPLYTTQCHQMLQADFKKVSVKDLRKLEQCLNFNYALIYKVLVSAKIPTGPGSTPSKVNASQAGNSASSPSSNMHFTVQVMTAENKTFPYECKRLKCGRPNAYVSRPFCPELEAELEFVQKEMKDEIENKDKRMAEQVNENEYEETGQLIECGCCYGEIPFEQMVQCYEGHLFCRECLTNYAKEAVYGQGKAELTCMSDGCPSSFPKDQMERALPPEMIQKYEERLKDEALNLAGIEDLVRCPSCDYAACLPPEEKVFSCQNQSCLKETCRYCKEDWTEHFGIPCSELEKKDETKMRIAYEEKMTQAMMRVCHKCKASFTKTEGCNRMTCRCKATMCYICREPDITYQHFCGHARDPGKACTSCKKCSLWSNPQEDDERAVQEIKKAAMEEKKAKGYDEGKEIGAPEEAKKDPPKAARPPAQQVQVPAPQQARGGQHNRQREQNHHRARDRELDRQRYLLQVQRQRLQDGNRYHHDYVHNNANNHGNFHGQQWWPGGPPARGMPPQAHNNNHGFHYEQQAAAANYAGNQAVMHDHMAAFNNFGARFGGNYGNGDWRN